jgi:hypothetical protein
MRCVRRHALWTKLADFGTTRGIIVENLEMLELQFPGFRNRHTLRHWPGKILCEHIAVQDCLRKIQERR